MSENLVLLQYHKSDNFGDALAFYIAQKLTEKEVHYVPQEDGRDHYVICGSILGGTNEHSIIWGAGFSYFNEPARRNNQVLMVRGKLTRDILLSNGYDCPEVYGDPGILISRLYPNPGIAKKYKLGIMAHWVDYDKCLRDSKEHLNIEVNLIDLLQPTETVINEMLACETIISSSLHGLIAAHSYGIPAAWCEFSDKVIGNGFKFWDYFSSIDIPFHQPLNLREKMSLEEILKHPKITPINPGKIDEMLNSCPFK